VSVSQNDQEGWVENGVFVADGEYQSEPRSLDEWVVGGVSGAATAASGVSIPVRIDSTDASAISCIISSQDECSLPDIFISAVECLAHTITLEFH
jgi:hypothetical protein